MYLTETFIHKAKQKMYCVSRNPTDPSKWLNETFDFIFKKQFKFKKKIIKFFFL